MVFRLIAVVALLPLMLRPLPNPLPEGEALQCRSGPDVGLVCWNPDDPPEVKRLPYSVNPSEPVLRFAMDEQPIKDIFPVYVNDKLTKVGRSSFSFKGDRVQPIFPVGFTVKPLGEVPLPQGVTVCDFFRRVRGVGQYDGKPLIVHETVLKCGEGYYLFTGMLFQAD